MIRVAVDANSLAWGWGGIPKYIHRLVSRLAAEDDLDVTLLANQRGPFARILGTTEVVSRRRGGALWRNSFVSEWVRRERPDVFWAPEAVAPWRVAAPLVVTIHDLGPILVPGSKPWNERLAYRATVRAAVRRAARVIAVSGATAADLDRLWDVDPETVDVVPNGIDELFTPGDAEWERRRVQTRWGIQGPFVLAVGSLEPRKGLDPLFAAAATAAGSRSWRLVLAGEPGYGGNQLARKARRAGCAVLGRVTEEELLTLYRAAAAVAVPSLYEGFGFTALEAMACGTPVAIAARSGGLVETSGEAAVVVTERTGRAWARGIEKAIHSRERFAQLGPATARRFSWSRAAAATAAVLRRAAQT